MRTKSVIACVVALLVTAHVSAEQEVVESLCKAHEHQYFSCHIQGTAKVASLCGSVDLSDETESAIYDAQDSAYLQYRFGTPEKNELVYPTTTKNSFKKFGGGNIRTYFGAILEVEFTIGIYRYNLSSASWAQNDERTKVSEFQGIKVWKGNNPPKEFHCTGNPFKDSMRKRDTYGDFDKLTRQLSENHQ